MIIQNKSGGRTVELFIPFEFGGKKIESITFSPFKLGHVLLWNEGHWKSMVDLMVELAGVEEAVIRELRYPDADRIMETFFVMLTPEVRQDIQDGRIPQPTAVDPAVDAIIPYKSDVDKVVKTNGAGNPQSSGIPVGPGVPLPEGPGFDLSEEAP